MQAAAPDKCREKKNMGAHMAILEQSLDAAN
jgi:hypothetical protein